MMMLLIGMKNIHPTWERSTLTVSTVVNCCLVCLVGNVPVYCAGGSGLISNRTNTQGLRIKTQIITKDPNAKIEQHVKATNHAIGFINATVQRNNKILNKG